MELFNLIIFLPLIGFLINGLLGKKLKSELFIGLIGTLSVAVPFVIALSILFNIVSVEHWAPVVKTLFTWISAGNLLVSFSYQIDQLSILFTLIITGIGTLIHIYSIGYMKKDISFYRFFSYLNLFIFMMLNLVLADNFLLTFLGWEGVGLCSYLLIGFWYDREFSGVKITWTGDAAKKAFITNRIGDFGFLIAMFLIFANFGTLNYIELNNLLYSQEDVIFWITLALFLGCCGKSAQLPLSVWLPDAMAGPTPVSALIHAATMVTAGIFLIARNSLLFSLSPEVMSIIATVGLITAIWAATIGLVQDDFKKVLAYSTVSQLGFMFAALGVGAFTAGVFHVMTHAFFKGLLFLGAGSVIHSMHNLQDIKKMGGLKKYMPTTYWTFMIATFAISGIPLFSGFFSKDEIMSQVYQNYGIIGWIILAIAAFCTTFYMFRLAYLVFFGEEKFHSLKLHPHESPKTMTIPLVILAILSAVGGFLGIPYLLGFWLTDSPSLIENYLHPIFEKANSVLQISAPHINALEYILILFAIIIAFTAIYVATKLYKKGNLVRATQIASNFKLTHKILLNKYYVDEFYYKAIISPILKLSDRFLLKIVDIKIVDGIVNGLAKLTNIISLQVRNIQTGVAQTYAIFMVIGIITIIGVLLVS